MLMGRLAVGGAGDRRQRAQQLRGRKAANPGQSSGGLSAADIWDRRWRPVLDGRARLGGATGGLGFETALGLSSAGAEVILAGRDGRKGKLALERIARAAPGANVRFGALDLASLQSVRAFAGTLMVENKPLDILINNAGVMDLPSRVLTADGFEMQFGTNHLGHFALTGLVLPLLRRARSSRVVNVSSMAHRGGKIEFDNLQAERRYRGWNAYQQSKLAKSIVYL